MTTRVGRVGRDNGVYIGRAGKGNDGYFGNPFPMRSEAERADVIRKYRAYFAERVAKDPVFKARVQELKGKTLLCFCAPHACHGDVIAEYLDDGIVQV